MVINDNTPSFYPSRVSYQYYMLSSACVMDEEVDNLFPLLDLMYVNVWVFFFFFFTAHTQFCLNHY